MRLSFLHRQHFLGAKIAHWTGIAVLVGIGLFIINANVLFTPTWSFRYHPGDGGKIIAPANKTALLRTADPTNPWRLAADSLTFHVQIPRLIQGVRVGATFTPGDANYVFLRAQGQQGADLTTIAYSHVLNTLSWPHTTTNGITVWSRPSASVTGKHRDIPVYSTIDEIRQRLADASVVGVAGIQPLSLFHVPTYSASSAPIAMDHALRGSHQLYVYADHEDVRLQFEKSDLNRIEGADTLTVRIARADALVGDVRQWLTTVDVADDGTTNTTGPNGRSQHVDVRLPDVAAGVYVLDIVTNDDVVISHLTLNQHLAAFNGRIYFAEGRAYGQEPIHPLDLTTNGSEVTFSLYHEQSKQDISIGGKTYPIRDVRVDHVVSGLRGTTGVHLPIGDGLITSDGLISITPVQLLPGRLPVKLNLATSPNMDGLDYIVAAYTPTSASTITVDHEYHMNELGLQSKTLTFTLGAPGTQAAGSTVGVSELRTTWIRGQFPWHKLWTKINGKS